MKRDCLKVAAVSFSKINQVSFAAIISFSLIIIIMVIIFIVFQLFSKYLFDFTFNLFFKIAY